VGSIQSPGVKWICRAEAKNECSYTSTPSYAFVPWKGTTLPLSLLFGSLGTCDLRFGALDKELKPAVWILGYFSGIKIHAESYHCAGSGVRQLPL